jgi:two-component system response regulator FlrC
VNLGAISKELAPSEIFGCKKGAFTGAVADRRGYIQDAEAGTLFLDEIDEADDNTQALLKRVVQFGTFNVVGSPDEMRCDVRFVAATNRVLADGDFIKEDLRDRFLEIRIPALRERRGDIRPLAEFFAGQSEYSLPEPVHEYLERLDWPGNVRQLQNVVERACALANSAEDLTLEAFEKSVRESGANPALSMVEDPTFRPLEAGETLKMRLRKVSKSQIEYGLLATNGNKKQTADYLGMTRAGLVDRMRELRIPDVR